MKKLNELRQQRAKLVDRNDAICKIMKDFPDDVEKRPGKATDEQLGAEYDENDGKIKALDAEIKTLEDKQRVWTERQAETNTRSAALARSTGTSVPVGEQVSDPEEEDDDDDGEGGGRHRRTRVIEKKFEPGIRLAKALRIAGAVRLGEYKTAKAIAEEVPELKTAMEAGSFAAGGAWIPENYVAELIELLRPISVVMSMGVTQAPLINGSLTLPKVTGGATAAYIGESVNIPPSQLTGGQLKATAHKLSILVPVSNELLRFSNPAADTIIRNDMVRAAAQARDAAHIRDDGTGNAPKGLRYWAPAANVETMTATPDLAKTDKDLGGLITDLLSANVFSIPRGAGVPQANTKGIVMNSTGWLISPRTWNYLTTLRNTNGFKAFPEMEQGMLKGFPYAVTSQIPENLGGGSDSEVYFAAFSDVVIAESPRVEIQASDVAAYNDGTNVQAAFSLDQTVIRMLMEDDLIVRHAEAVAVLTGVTWGT